MKMLRVCSSYPEDMKISDSPLLAMRFVQEEAYRMANVTYQYERVDRVEECMDQIASNMTDLTGNWASLKTLVSHVKFFAIHDASTQVILSAYDQVTTTSGTSVLTSFKAWSPLTLIAISLLLSSAVLVYKAHSCIYRDYKTGMAEIIYGEKWKIHFLFSRKPICLWQYILCLLMYQPGSCPSSNHISRKSLSIKLTHVMMLLLILMIAFYFNSFIRTDLVTVNKAVIIDSYQQILDDPKLKVRWLTHESDYNLYQGAAANSIRNQLWQKSQPDPKITILHEVSGLTFIKELDRSEIVLIGATM